MDTALLTNDGNMTLFKFGSDVIRFRSPDRLERYIEIKLWNHGYIEVLTEYSGIGIVEEYIDLVPILENLYITPDKFLSPIKYLKIG